MAVFYDQEGCARKELRTNGNAQVLLDMESGHQFTVNCPTAATEGHHRLCWWRLNFHDDDPESENIVCRLRVRRIEADSQQFLVYFRDCEQPLHLALTEEDAIVSFAGWFNSPLWLEMVEK